jgi:MFS transporter, DHA2 family, multidrug resistance protein
MGTIILGISLSVIDGTVVNLALPGMVRDLHSSASSAVWIVNAYQLATLVLLLPLATLGDRLSYRRVYLWGAVIFTLGSAASSTAGSLGALALARAVQGIGAAGLMSVNAALVRLTYPSELLGRGIALNSVVVATASVAGPVVGAAVLSFASWPWLFLINIPLGIGLIAVGSKFLPANQVRVTQAGVSALDVVLNGGMFVLLFLGADLLVPSAKSAGELHTSPLWGAALLASCVVVAVVHVFRQRAKTHPLLPIDLLRIPVFRLSMATSVCAFAAQMLAYVALPFLFLDVWRETPAQAGTLMACWPLALIVAAVQSGRMIGRHSDGLLGAVGLALLAAGLALLAMESTASSAGGMWWRLAVCGLGFGLFQSPNNHAIITSAPRHRSGAASGMLGTARLTGQSLGAALLAAVFAVSGSQHQHGAEVALLLASCLAAGAAMFSGFRIRFQRR